jgi:hypothetical protein
MKKIVRIASGLILFAFGALTLFMGTSVLLDLFGLSAEMGHYVPFIVWANIICGFLYLAAGFGFIRNKPWTTRLLIIATIILLIAFVGLFVYINSGGVYEIRTVKAMTFRTALTIAFSGISYFSLSDR